MMAPLFSEWIRTTKYSLLLCLIWTSVAIDISINSNAAASETQHTTHTDATVPRFIQGCQDKYPMARDKCIANYEDRIQYSKLHSDLQVNYTKAGFQIIQLPDAIKTQLQHFWDKNYEITKTMEVWNIADVYSNHWESPTIMVPLDTEDAAPVVQSIKDRIGAAMEDWTGMSLQPISLYGIRIFQSGAIIPSHVDRAPFMFTAILNVAQDVDEDWNMLIAWKDGRQQQVSVQPGQAILYESLLLAHGHPYPLHGRFYATIHIHFVPIKYTPLQWTQDRQMNDMSSWTSVQQAYEQKHQDTVRTTHINEADSTNQEQEAASPRIPYFILPGTHEAKRWNQELNYVHLHGTTSTTARTSAAHFAAIYNDLRTLKRIAKIDQALLFAADENGWQPIHEASRVGHTAVVKYLLQQGADVNSRTHSGRGSSPMHVAIDSLGKDHAVVKFLQQNGGVVIVPSWFAGSEQQSSLDIVPTEEKGAATMDKSADSATDDKEQNLEIMNQDDVGDEETQYYYYKEEL